MNKNTLLIAGTHGDEPIGPALLKELSSRSNLKNYQTVIGNPRAVKKNIRFTEADLNRAAPGDKDSKVYEVKRAAQLIKLFKKFNQVIDIHETKTNDRIVIIIPRLCLESLKLALALDIKTILIWPPSAPQTHKGPLVQYAKSGLEIECGTKKSLKMTLKDLVRIVSKFLKTKTDFINNNLELKLSNLKKKEFYLVYDRINPREVKNIILKNFKPVKTKHDKFTPLLFGAHQGLIGYKMRRLNGQTVYNNLLNKKADVF